MAFADFLDWAIGGLRLGLLDAIEQGGDLAHATASRQQCFEAKDVALHPSGFTKMVLVLMIAASLVLGLTQQRRCWFFRRKRHARAMKFCYCDAQHCLQPDEQLANTCA